MKTVKVSELTPPALDWAAAEANGTPIYRDGKTLSRVDVDGGEYWQPTLDWAQGGPIIELEEITLAWGKDTEDWWACVGDSRRFDTDTPDGVTTFVDPQPLIAAMRCYVASKLGDEVETPEELK